MISRILLFLAVVCFAILAGSAWEWFAISTRVFNGLLFSGIFFYVASLFGWDAWLARPVKTA